MSRVQNRTLYISPLSHADLRAFIRLAGTQVEVAAMLGVSPRAITGYLNGSIQPSRTVLILGALLARQDAGKWPLE